MTIIQGGRGYQEPEDWTPRQKKIIRDSDDMDLPLTIHWGKKTYFFNRDYFWARVQCAILLLMACGGVGVILAWWARP